MCTPERELNPPDCGTDDHPNALFDAVMRLLDTTPMLHEYDEELCLVASHVNLILSMDISNGEKMAFINDAFYKAKSNIADAVVKNHEFSGYHAHIAYLATGDN
jgi:hypothetical protein